jgi:hypothetical protein
MEQGWNNSQNSLGIIHVTALREKKDCWEAKTPGSLLTAQLQHSAGLHANLFWRRFKKMPTTSFACAEYSE